MKSVINLIKTPQGYSLLEGDIEINKNTNKIVKEKNFSLPKKFAQQNFTIYPYIPNRQSDNRKYILIPAKTQWFNFNTVHEIEKKALPEWFKIKKGILATMNNIKFEKHQELYKKYRNYIIQLAKDQYLSPTKARRGLAGDACAIIRIHAFLEKWGLINYIHQKPALKKSSKGEKQEIKNKEDEAIPLSKRKDCFDKDKLIISRSYGKDDLELLKKITRKFKQICHFCEGVTGVVWFQYEQKLYLKQFVQATGKKSKQIKNSQTPIDYSLIVCASCFYEGTIPIVLSAADFKKKSIMDELDQQSITHESDKKKNNEQNKVADAIQKNRFNVSKTAEQLKMTLEYVFKILMTMPIQKLQKISRIEPETDADKEKSNDDSSNEEVIQERQVVHANRKEDHKTLEAKMRKQVFQLQSQQREIYQKFLQTWLLKINLKLQKLSEWDSGVTAKYESIIRLQKNLLAQRIVSLAKTV